MTNGERSRSALGLPAALQQILKDSFFIRITMRKKSTGAPRTVELTYLWDGKRIVLSGYPGKRDWVANMAAHPDVMVHTVEFEPWYDIPARARVIRGRKERLPHLIAYIDHWATRPGYERPLIKFVVRMVRLNRAMHLPMWGPFWLLRRNIFDHMPCVELQFTGPAVVRPSGGPPPLSEAREGRP